MTVVPRVRMPPPAVFVPERTKVPRPDLVMCAAVANGSGTEAVRRGVNAEEPGLMTWKTYSLAEPVSRSPPVKPLSSMVLSEDAAANGFKVNRKAPLPEVRTEPADPVTANAPLVASARPACSTKELRVRSPVSDRFAARDSLTLSWGLRELAKVANSLAVRAVKPGAAAL